MLRINLHRTIGVCVLIHLSSIGPGRKTPGAHCFSAMKDAFTLSGPKNELISGDLSLQGYDDDDALEVQPFGDGGVVVWAGNFT